MGTTRKYHLSVNGYQSAGGSTGGASNYVSAQEPQCTGMKHTLELVFCGLGTAEGLGEETVLVFV